MPAERFVAAPRPFPPVGALVGQATLPEPVYDEFGRLVKEQPFKDPWPVRLSLASALTAASALLAADDLTPFVGFLIVDGLADRHEAVRQQMLQV